MSTASADIFGIQMIKPTKSGGQVWYQYNVDFNDDPQVYTYSATNEYVLHNIKDADGTQFTISSSKAFETYISPTTGLNPALCITDQKEMARRGYMQNSQDWKNVECTIQLVIFEESTDFITLGFRGGKLQGSGAPQGCTGSMYLVEISMAQGGLIRVRKQSWNVSVHNWLSVLASGFDSGKVCGFTFKVLVYNNQDVTGVNVEVYVASANDNHFVKVLSGIDTGAINTDATVCNCTNQGQPFIWGSPAIMLKGTTGQFGFKNWSIREIQGYGTNLPPAPPPPGGGDTGGSGGGTGGGGSGTGGGGGTGGGEPPDLTPILATPQTSYVVSGGGPNTSPLTFHVIFAGSAWSNTSSTESNKANWTLQTKIKNSINAIFSSNYFKALIQYGLTKAPKVDKFVVNTTTTISNNYTTANITALVNDSLNKNQVPKNTATTANNAYVVILPPNIKATGDLQGLHFSNHTTYYDSIIAICPTSDYDLFTRSLSVFLVGTTANVSGADYKGYTIKSGTPLDSKVSQYGKELGAVCFEEHTTYNNVVVSKYWSDQAGKCDVPLTTSNPTPFISCHTGAIYDNVNQVCKTQPGSGGGGTTPGTQQGYTIKAVQASDDDGNVPGNAVDGKMDTRWSAFGKGSWIQFDLGVAKKVNKLKIAWYQGDKRTNDFEIKTSSNATDWTTKLAKTTTTKGSAALQDYTIPETECRYIRIYVYGNSLNDWCSISEVEIWGPGTTTGGDPGGGDDDNPGGDNGGGTTNPPPPVEAAWNFFDTSFSCDYVKIGQCNPAE